MNIKTDPTAEAVKRRLRQVRRAARALEEKRGRIAALESLTEGVRGVLRGKDGQACAAREAGMLNTLVELRSALLEDVLRYAALVRETEEILAQCLPDERHRAVMESHYLGFAPWEAVAEQVGYTPRHVMRLHKEALRFIAEHMCHIDAPPAGEAAI